MESQKIKLETDYKLSDLFNEIDKGQLRLPRFQRDFVWERKKVISLLDSIYSEYPIGSFFIWNAHEQYKSLYRNIAELKLPEPEEDRPLRYILDGQQRATSLYVAIRGLTVNSVDYGKICFDLETEKFVDKAPNGTNLVSVSSITNSANFTQTLLKLPMEYQETFLHCTRKFENYPLSVIIVKDKGLSDAIEIFERINRGGKPLAIFDLVVASTWSETFDLKERYLELKRQIDEGGFGSIPPEVVTHSAALIIKGYSAKSYQLQIKGDQLVENWNEIAIAIKQSVEYLRLNFGVRIIEFIPYPAMIAMLAYVFYNTKGRAFSADTADAIHEWFWKAALSERYSGSLETKMGEDRRNVFDVILEGKKPEMGVVSLSPARVREVRISNRSAIRNAFFCLLALKQPRHFKTNGIIAIDSPIARGYSDPEKHHIFPRNYIKKLGLGSDNLIANFCFIPAELNKEITDRTPSEYFADFAGHNNDFEETLASHYISYSDAIKNDNYHQFLNERSKSIFDAFEKLIGAKIYQNLEGGASKVLDTIESKVRKLIVAKLAPEWDTSIPNKIILKINDRLHQLSEHTQAANSHVTHFEQVSQLDIMDYERIIENNWNAFADVFIDLSLMKSRLRAWRKYRNDIRHARAIDGITEKEGEAAVAWLSRCLQIKTSEQNQLSPSKELEPVTLEHHIRNKPSDLVDLFMSLKKFMMDLHPGMRENIVRSYISYRVDDDWWCTATIQQRRIYVETHRAIADPEQRFSDRTQGNFSSKVIYLADKETLLYIEKVFRDYANQTTTQ
jgi:predicted transport protein